VTGLSDGGFVVVWSDGVNGANGQRYDATGAMVGGQFTVNTTGTVLWSEPSVTALPNGGFTVSWTSGNGSIQTRTYDHGSTLTGSAASETLTGGTGNDKFNGGGGTDTLVGGGGYDSYSFASGYGSATIVNSTSSGTTAAGELDFGAGLTAQNLWFMQSGQDLVVDILGTNDQVTVKGWFGANTSAKLAEIKTSNGMEIDSNISQLVTAMATYQSGHPSFNPQASGTTMPTDTTLQTTITSSWHSQ